ncbi:MAG: tRNA (N(6)-L-threonylcarbamoyladenosine(37)-C(2))-methylthiotransferase MtaB [Ruminococcaceae bacterium]|nr:tRNA (N(6)-L-threonylcarbamoyladenosine(37)-C(2))-methylthiotransferase MtaB [Oscillospiraceae bacterium]
MKVFFTTFGCKVNQYETQEMSELLVSTSNYTLTNEPGDADIIIVNSCTVTAEGVRKVRQTIRKLKKANSKAIMVLTGCASQAEPQIVKDLPEIDILMGNRTNTNIVYILDEYFKSPSFSNAHEKHLKSDSFLGTGISKFEGHTRAFLKIQDGCDRYCAYCLIPYARGFSRSKPLEMIDEELKNLNKNGYKEIVFVGINLSDYGKNTPYSLPDALALAEKYENIERIRLGSLEPDHITKEMIERLAKIKKLCPQFHISLQSGSNSVLKKMNRHYKAEEYEALTNNLRNAFPEATITTDILTGFPTETEEEFLETVEFAKKIKFEKAHIFPYSLREGTKAATLPQLQKSVKEQRAKLLTQITNATRKEYLKNQIGKTVNVLFETDKEEFSEGYTENYTPVRVYDTKARAGQILKIKITDAADDYCIGE